MARPRKSGATAMRKKAGRKIDAPRTPLSRETVLAAALALLDDEGLERFSMRKLAERLGVATMAPYYLFESRDELLAAVYQQAFAERPFPEPGGAWLDEAIRIAHWIRDGYLAHPSMVAVRNVVEWPTPASVVVAERLLRVLERAGLSGEALARAYYASTSAILGIVEQEALSLERPVSQDLQHAVRDAPLLSTTLPRVARVDRRASFERSIRTLLRGLADPDGSDP